MVPVSRVEPDKCISYPSRPMMSLDTSTIIQLHHKASESYTNLVYQKDNDDILFCACTRTPWALSISPAREGRPGRLSQRQGRLWTKRKSGSGQEEVKTGETLEDRTVE